MFLTDISLKRPVFAFVVIIALIAVGIVSFMYLPLNQLPDIDIPYVTITVVEPGASPDQIESKVTKKVEDAVGQISGVKHISSIINDNVSTTVVEFIIEKSADQAALDIRDKIAAARGDLPTDIEEPVISKIDINAMPIISLVVSGTASDSDMSSAVNDVIVKRLNMIKGVGSVSVSGDQEREIHIKIDKEKLAAFGITASEVVSSLQSDNMDIPGGKLSNGDQQISLRTNGTVKNLGDFKNILVGKRNNTEIRVRDIAEVEDGIKEKESLAFYQGKKAIGIDIVKQSGENTVSVAESIKSEIGKLQASLSGDMKIEIIRDNSILIHDSVNSVMETLIEGCILAVIIVFLFLREGSSTLISAVTLPTSIISTFIAMKVMNFSLNLMTLIALSLAIGLLIDDAIVVIENVVRHLHMGKSPLQAAKDGTSEIGLAVMATTLSVVAVFLPVAMVGGMMGKFIKQFGLTIAVSVLVSLFVSFTLVPLMSSKYLKLEGKAVKGKLGSFLLWFNGLFDRLAAVYSRFLNFALKHRKASVGLAAAILVASLLLIPVLGFTNSTSVDNGEISVTASLDAGMTLEKAEKATHVIEGVLQQFPEVRFIYSTSTSGKASIFVKLSDKQERKKNVKQIAAEMREKLGAVPGIDLSIIAGSTSSSYASKDAQYNFKGEDFEQLLAYVQKAKKALESMPGAVDVGIDYKAGQPEAKLEVNRDKAADLGVSPVLVASTIRTLFNGTTVGQYETEKDRYDVSVLLKDSQRKDFSSLSGIYVSSGTGKQVPFEQLTEWNFSTSSSTINRYDKSRVIKLGANVIGVSQMDFDNAFKKKLKEIRSMPKGVTLEAGAQQESMSESVNSMIVAMLMGILFIFLILSAQFESFIDPMAIMFSLPLAIIGAILGLFVTNNELSTTAMIGVVMLMGLVTKNAILLIDFTKQRRSEGKERREAILEAASIRLRPILMTTLAMIFGMIPVAVSNGSSSEMIAPMAITIIGGLITSTLLTLVIVPIMYTLLDDLKGKFAFGKKTNVVGVTDKLA